MQVPCYVSPWSETSRTPKEVLVGCRDAGHDEDAKDARKVAWQKPGLIPGRRREGTIQITYEVRESKI